MAFEAPLRRSCRKRSDTEDEPHAVVRGKRQAVANPKTGEPMQMPSARRSAARMREHSASVEKYSIPNLAIATMTSASTPSYLDPVPADCCYRCRNRGGNAAYNCAYENGSDACNLCIKEKGKCKLATAEELAKSEARCPQCKQRGFTNCSGPPQCDKCTENGKQCNAPTKRKANTRTGSSLGLAIPESERLAEATVFHAVAKEYTQSVSLSTTAHVDTVDALPRPSLPLQIRRSTRRSTAIPSNDVMSDLDSAKTISDLTTVSTASQQPKRKVSGVTRSRISHVPSVTASCGTSATHDTALLKSASSRRSSKWSKESTSLAMMQQATPEDSADDEATLYSTDVDMDYEESASFQLMTENHQAGSLSSMKTGAGAPDNKALPAYFSHHREQLYPDRNRVSVLIPHASRPRRSQGRPSYIEKAMSDTSVEECRYSSSENDDDFWDPSATEIESELDEDGESNVLFSGSSDDETGQGSGPDDVEPEPLPASRQRSRSHKHANTDKPANTRRPAQHTPKRQTTTTMSDGNPPTYKGEVLTVQPKYIRWKRELIVQADTEGVTALFHTSNSDETESILDEPIMSSRKKKDTDGAQVRATPKQGKGIDSSLPPLDDIRGIVADMATRAGELGLDDVLRKLDGRPINVATMCSGTESPLLFLQMLDEALQSKGMGSLPVKHHFSAEIDATKQAYIERNFHPRILFRDVRELGEENATTATTAYGAEEPIPGDLDILVAGFVCKDLSLLNSNRKTVNDQGETGDTWRAIYHYAKHFQPGIVLLENVKSKTATWRGVVEIWSEIGYEADWGYFDSKAYYIPQTRERMYMIAINRKKYGGDASKAVAAWKSSMNKLKRQCSSHYEAFLAKLPASIAAHSALSSESSWELCKLRYDQIRSEERLGTRRPVTQWSESGTLNPPDYANRKWYDSQSSRVYDAIDVAHLQAAKEGHDSMYKMKIWDVSQNVDRFKTGLGIVPCITPGGCHFASNRQDALNGTQTLVLQGMPLDKLHFAGETQRECQDLAGNAMTTTVIGASLISAILHGYKVFRSDPLAGNQDANSRMPSTTKNCLVQASAMETHEDCQPASDSLNVARLLAEANLTSRKCACEGDQRISEKDIRICSGCGHTACATCASNPRHQYTDGPQRNSRQTPGAFIKAWRPQLPPRLNLANFTGLQEIHKRDKAYAKRILQVDIGSQQFCLSDSVRCDNEWKITYVGNNARLVLSVGIDAQWLLYVDCLRELPGNSELRKALETPIARAKIDDSLLGATWEIFVPSVSKFSLQVRGSTGRSKSWRNSLGLLDYQDEMVPTKIHVQSRSEDTDVQGEYVHLPHCGTAEASLYKRSTEPALYLFLEPDPVGKSGDDCFVFSYDCSKKQPGDSRTTVARLDTAWRPWKTGPNEQHTITAVRAGSWKTIEMKLEDLSLSPVARILKPWTELTGQQVECTTALTILDAHIPGKLSVNQFSDYSWALEKVRMAPQLEQWQQLDAQNEEICDCSPAYPNIQWSIDQTGKATPHEDRKSAATFERGIKSRCPIFDVHTDDDKDMTRIEVGISLASLVHRAKGRLRRLMSSNESIKSSWRLLTDHADISSARLPAFCLRSNVTDAPYAGLLSLKGEHELRGTQPQALAWMRKQEAGVQLEITEVEEAIHSGLNWRAEACAQTTTKIRGGVLADLPSFGKTVTTIALIQSELEESSPGAIIRQNQSVADGIPHLIDTAATLIVCPPHIAMQWRTEFEEFLGKAFGVRSISDFAELKKLTIQDFQESRVIVVSWSVLSASEYTSQLAWTAAMPEPADPNCRAFSTWMKAASEYLPTQISKLQDLDFKQNTQDLLQHRLKQPEFQASLPMKVQHGSNYQSYETVQTARASRKEKSRKSQPPPKQKPSGLSRNITPLFHMFRFNRVVVDEYHYLNDDMKTAISVKEIRAHKRWILSGTPALANFTDVDNIASFLGVQLGRFAVGAGKRTVLDETIINDQTAVERFLSMTEVMSHQWHQARHQRAQEFLDLFVRQNEASLEYILCQEELCAVDLDIAHHAVYLELSQHLISQRMQVKRLRNKADSDRTSRLNASLNNSKTAEDALLKAVLDYETSAEESGLQALVQKRSRQCQETEAEIQRLMQGFEWHMGKGFEGLNKLYTSFTQDVQQNAWLGDFEATQKVGQLLRYARKHPNKKGLEELRGVSGDKTVKEAKTALSHLRQLCAELALRFRSQRFVSSVEFLREPLCNESHGPIQCNTQNCPGALVKEMYLASECGHLTCGHCMLARGEDDNCVVKGCSCTVQTVDFIKATDLGSEREDEANNSYGRKTNSIARLIKEVKGDDQWLVFAPNEETIAVLRAVFKHYKILYLTPSGYNSRKAAEVVEEFKASAAKNIKDPPKVLLLNLASETAAGVNLTNANHIIFVSPLLVESQYKYDSAMTQAIARCRRYGQEKKVHIHHFAAMRTIDVDILEHRHKRKDGITSAHSKMRLPQEELELKEKTRLVRNKQGEVALVPISWLDNAQIREGLGVEKEPEKFTSLINFSETFQDVQE